MRPSLSFKLTSFSKLPISVKGIFICIFLYVRVYVCEVFANTKTLWKNFMDCVRQSYFDGYEHGVKATATKDFLNLSESISQYEKKEKSKENNKSIVPGAVPYYRSQGSLCCSCYSCRKGMLYNNEIVWYCRMFWFPVDIFFVDIWPWPKFIQLAVAEVARARKHAHIAVVISLPKIWQNCQIKCQSRIINVILVGYDWF